MEIENLCPYDRIKYELEKNGYQHLNLPELFPIRKRELVKKYVRRIMVYGKISGDLIAGKRSQEFLDQWLPKTSVLRLLFERERLRHSLSQTNKE